MMSAGLWPALRPRTSSAHLTQLRILIWNVDRYTEFMRSSKIIRIIKTLLCFLITVFFSMVSCCPNPDSIKPGMTKDEVVRQIGEPDVSFEISGTRTLVYRCILRKTLFVDLDNSGFVKEVQRK